MLESKLDPPYYFSSPREGCEVLRSGCVGVSVRLTVSQKRHVQTCHFSAPVACDRGAVFWDNNAIRSMRYVGVGCYADRWGTLPFSERGVK